MPVPKKKKSTMRRDQRRHAKRAKTPAFSICPNCKAYKQPHHVCPQCGHYQGRLVLK